MPLARARVVSSLLLLAAALSAQADPDGDGDGLSDFAERHKYRTDPGKKDSDGDGVPDGDWLERREYQYTVRAVVQVMRPVTPEFLCDDHQDARVLDATDTYVELEVVLYPFTTVAAQVVADPQWRQSVAAMSAWTAPGTTADWTPAMRSQLMAALAKDGIAADRLDDKELVERAARWLCVHAKNHDAFTTFVTAFDAKGKPFVPDELKAAVPNDAKELPAKWERDIFASGMFRHRLRGSCSSSAIYLNGCLRALGIPTRIVLCIPLVDANDAQERRLVERGLTHHALRAQVVRAVKQLDGSWASHSFNEVFVGGRWRRLNYERLGQDMADPGLFGVAIHVATFSDWADARMPETIARRQTLRAYDDVFGGLNPYSTIALRDQFGVHCTIANEALAPVDARVTAVAWGDGKDAPADVQRWFANSERFGLVARIEGPRDHDEFARFLAEADLRVLLVADGKKTLGVGVERAAWWWRGDHGHVVVPFGPADRRDVVGDVEYRLVPRNDKPGGKLVVAPGVVVKRRG
jgi:hypothetical protein